MATERANDLRAFKGFIEEKRSNGGADLTLDEAVVNRDLSRRLIGFDGEPRTRSGAIVLSAQTVMIVGHPLNILDGAAAILLHLVFRSGEEFLNPL